MKSIAEILSRIIRTYSGEDDFCLAMLQVLWPHLVGGRVAAQSYPVRLRLDSLTVATSNPIWRRELQQLAGLLLESIATCLGAGRVRVLDFCLAPLPRRKEVEPARNEGPAAACNLTEDQIRELLAPVADGVLREALASVLRAYPGKL